MWLLSLHLAKVARENDSTGFVLACRWSRTRGVARLLWRAFSRQFSSCCRLLWSKGDRSHLRRQRRLLPAGVQRTSSTSRLSCHCGGLSAKVQLAPASLSQVALSPATSRLAVPSSAFVALEKEQDPLVFLKFCLGSFVQVVRA